LKIAYDLRYAADHFVGIGTYAYRVLEALLAADGDDTYTVFWNPDLPATRYDLAPLRAHRAVRWTERRESPLRPWTPARTAAWLREERPEAYFSPYHLLPDGAGCPRLVTVHDLRPFRFRGELTGLRGWLYRRSVRNAARAEAVLTVSEFSRREVETLLHAPRVRVAMPGASRALLALTPVRPARAPEHAFALVVGDNRPHKNLELLAAVWSSARAPGLPLVGVGPVDPRHPDLATLARRTGAADVTALGRVSEAELAWLYRNARLVLCPSRYEGFCSPLAEALLHGVPVIASDVPALRETGADAPLFVPPDDVSAWSAAIRGLSEDSEARRLRAAAGRLRVDSLRYSATAGAVRAAIEEVVSARIPA